MRCESGEKWHFRLMPYFHMDVIRQSNCIGIWQIYFYLLKFKSDPVTYDTTKKVFFQRGSCNINDSETRQFLQTTW